MRSRIPSGSRCHFRFRFGAANAVARGETHDLARRRTSMKALGASRGRRAPVTGMEDDLWQQEGRPRFPMAYKLKAIKRVKREEGVLPVARELGISPQILQ